MSYIRSCELSEDVTYQRIWTVKWCKLSENVTCQRFGTVTEDMNCQFMRTVRGCEQSEENHQRMSHIRCELSKDVIYLRMWLVRGYQLPGDINCQRMWTVRQHNLSLGQSQSAGQWMGLQIHQKLKLFQLSCSAF